MSADPPAAEVRHKWWGRWWVKALAWSVALLAILHIAEREIGELAWRRYQADAARRGVKLRIADYVQPPIPDSDNFAATPYFNEPFAAAAEGREASPFMEMPNPVHEQPNKEETLLLDVTRVRDGMIAAGWLKAAGPDPAADVLQAMERLEPQMAEIRAACSRPSARYPVQWEDGFAMKLPHLAATMGAARPFSVRARALLLQGHSAEALEEWRCIMRIQRSFQHEPTLVSALIQMAIFKIGSDIAEKGMAADAWSDADLKVIVDEVAKDEPLTAMPFSLNSERACFNQATDALMSLKGEDLATSIGTLNFSVSPPNRILVFVCSILPRGWLRHNQVTCNELTDILLEPGIGMGEKKLRQKIAGYRSSPVSLYRGFLASIAMPTVANSVNRFHRWDASIGALKLGCALSRYWHRYGEFPEKADALVPEWIDAVPRDVMNGKAMRYRRNVDGGVDIWSIGEDQIDDGGAKDAKVSSFKQPDWVWSLPAR